MSSESITVLEDFDLSFLDHPCAVYSKELKIQACSIFTSIGSVRKTAESLGLPIPVVDHWKKEAPWWNELTQHFRKEKQQELDALLTNAVHKAVNDLTDRLENGDFKLDLKTGELHRVPVGAKDLAVISAIVYDKRALLRGEATQIRVDSKGTLEALENKFKNFALQLKEKDVIEQSTT